MPRFKVTCQGISTTRVTVEINVVSADHARRKIEDSSDPLVEFEQTSGFEDDVYDLENLKVSGETSERS